MWVYLAARGCYKHIQMFIYTKSVEIVFDANVRGAADVAGKDTSLPDNWKEYLRF